MNIILDPNPSDATELAKAIAVTLGDVTTDGPRTFGDGSAATVVRFPGLVQAMDFNRFLVRLQELAK